jgi:hypothetical protein
MVAFNKPVFHKDWDRKWLHVNKILFHNDWDRRKLPVNKSLGLEQNMVASKQDNFP